MPRSRWEDWDEDENPEEVDEYDRPRPTEWSTLDEAMDAADASPVLRDGAVIITWVRHGPDGREERRYAWRDTDLGMDLPKGAEIISRRKKGSWQTP